MTAVILVQVIFRRLRASSYNFENKEKYSMNLRFIKVQQVKLQCVKSFLSQFCFYFSYTKMNFRYVFFDPSGNIFIYPYSTPQALSIASLIAPPNCYSAAMLEQFVNQLTQRSTSMCCLFNKVSDPLKVRHALDCIAADTNYLNIYLHIYV